MKAIFALIPVVLAAQAPDQATRERLRAFARSQVCPITLSVAAQFEVKEFFSKSQVRSAESQTIEVRQEGNTFIGIRKDLGKRLSWTRPLSISPGHENPSEPARIDAWLRPHRLDALLDPAAALATLMEVAVLKETKGGAFDGELVRIHTYRFKTRVPEKFEPYGIDRDATLRLTVSSSGEPRMAELATGYRGRMGRRGDPFGRSTNVRWTFQTVSGALATRAYDLWESHSVGWTTTSTTIGIRAIVGP